MLKVALQWIHGLAAGIGLAVIAGMLLSAIGVGEFSLRFRLVPAADAPATVDEIAAEPTLST